MKWDKSVFLVSDTLSDTHIGAYIDICLEYTRWFDIIAPYDLSI